MALWYIPHSVDEITCGHMIHSLLAESFKRLISRQQLPAPFQAFSRKIIVTCIDRSLHAHAFSRLQTGHRRNSPAVACSSTCRALLWLASNFYKQPRRAPRVFPRRRGRRVAGFRFAIYSAKGRGSLSLSLSLTLDGWRVLWMDPSIQGCFQPIQMGCIWVMVVGIRNAGVGRCADGIDARAREFANLMSPKLMGCSVFWTIPSTDKNFMILLVYVIVGNVVRNVLILTVSNSDKYLGSLSRYFVIGITPETWKCRDRDKQLHCVSSFGSSILMRKFWKSGFFGV